MVCNVRLPSRRGGWRSRERGAVGRRAAVRGLSHEYDQANTKGFKRNAIHLIWTGLSSFSLVIFLFLFSSSAYAAPSIEVDGNFAGYENGETYKGYIVVDAPNEYIATLVLIDEYSSLVQIDTEVYAKLMSESHGGRFYELMQEWEKIGTAANGSTSHYVSWGGSEDYQAGLTVVYGYGRVWECVTTDALIEGAKEDFNTILDGGSLGGPSGEPEEGTITNDNGWIVLSGSPGWSDDTGLLGYDISMRADKWNAVIAEFEKYNYQYIFLAIGGQNGNPYTASANGQWNLIFTNSKPEYENGTDYKDGFNYSGRLVAHNTAAYMPVDNEKKRITIPYDVIGVGAASEQTDKKSNVWPVVTYFFGTPEGSISGGGGSDDPVPDPPTQPTDPTPPSDTPPTPPTINPPSSPNPPTITPYNPTNPNPPTNTTPPSGTTPTDYTPWLQAILQQLINMTSYLETCFTWLGTALDEHCQHIRDHMTACSQFIGDYVVGGMSSLLGEHHSFLNGLAQWIVDNLKWENSGGEFDDSNMIYWLRRIYARQGSGDVNSRPVDPATDYSGFAGWLGVLYDAVALDVSDTSLVALTSSLSGLQHTFPFSLPWDIRQVLQALDVSPVTPSASIPIYGLEGESYDVDLHWMDSAMVSVRAFELLVFIVYVMVHTKDLFGYLMGE